MSRVELETVLRNWIRSARGSGELPEGTDEASFVAEKFVQWWREEANASLEEAEAAALPTERELNRLGGLQNPELESACEESVHLRNALHALRSSLGLAE
ncbi:MAG: hypothetical protein AAF488_03765 [Planctomycetota bacterium]